MTETANDVKDERGSADGPDKAAHAVDVVEGEVGSARLKEPTEVEAEGRRDDVTDGPGSPAEMR